MTNKTLKWKKEFEKNFCVHGGQIRDDYVDAINSKYIIQFIQKELQAQEKHHKGIIEEMIGEEDNFRALNIKPPLLNREERDFYNLRAEKADAYNFKRNSIIYIAEKHKINLSI